MRISQKGVDLIKKFEGFSSSPYLCPAGVPTIGYGSTYYENGQKVTMKDPPITEEWAELLLRRILYHYELGVDSFTRDDITQNQFDALVSFAYNVGLDAFKKSTLLKKINVNSKDPEITKQFMRWIRAGGRVIQGLINRRKVEAQLYFS